MRVRIENDRFFFVLLVPQIEFILKMWVDDKELESSQQFKIAL